MTEIDLIVKYLELRGSKVQDIFYYDEHLNYIADGSKTLGAVNGYGIGDAYFFGNISIYTRIDGVIVLANKNAIDIVFYHLIKATGQNYVSNISVGVGSMNLMGNGAYEDNRRLYGMGLNRVIVARNDFGAATFQIDLYFNGYRFMMK